MQITLSKTTEKQIIQMFSAKDYLNPLIFMGRKLLSEAKIKVGKMAIFDHKVEILPFGTTF